ncbi:MAG: hypothetical protein A2X46_01090 [Lentisphaerae bacterium GWF2_57_35]|nr:MAG: hypothetical protein A2X46_01090 [Lentisphaerae bacterium GWF2_57_35]
MHKFTRRTSRAGFTLVEIVVATFLLVLGLTGIHNLLYWIMYATSMSGQRTQAAALTQDKMEELLGAGFSASASGSAVQSIYDLVWVVDAPGNGEQEVTVRVSWEDFKKRSHEITTQAILADSRLSASGIPFDKPRK